MKEFDQAAPGLIMNTQSDGSLTNIDRVMDNQAELGVTQLDALVVRAFKETNLRERIRGWRSCTSKKCISLQSRRRKAAWARRFSNLAL
jgi:hypothetical protein